MAAQARSARIAGLLMIGAALLIVLAMAHHPSGMHGGGLGGLVHGAMIVLLMVLAWGFLTLAVLRGPVRPLILAGLLAYAVSLFAHLGAATINGFVVPALAASGPPPVSHDLFRFAWYFNQALAKLGVYMTGAAYLLWSIDLLSDSSGRSRLAGATGVAAGLVPAALLAAGVLRMDVAGAFVIYAVHAAWAALVGLLMWQGLGQQSGNAATSS